MKKRILSVLLCFAMIAVLSVTSQSISAAPVDPQIRIVADKTEAVPGDTVNFSIVLGPVSDIGSLSMNVVIPDGLTYVSGKLDPGARDALGFNKNKDWIDDIHLKWTASSKMLTGDNGFEDIVTTSDVTLVNFSCIVDEGTAGTLRVTLDCLEMCSLQIDDDYDFTDLFTIVPAEVTVKDDEHLGDVDGDGEITSVDATWIQRALAFMSLPAAFDETAADVDGDGEITSVDATWIQRALAHMYIPAYVRIDTDAIE